MLKVGHCYSSFLQWRLRIHVGFYSFVMYEVCVFHFFLPRLSLISLCMRSSNSRLIEFALMATLLIETPPSLMLVLLRFLALTQTYSHPSQQRLRASPLMRLIYH